MSRWGVRGSELKPTILYISFQSHQGGKKKNQDSSSDMNHLSHNAPDSHWIEMPISWFLGYDSPDSTSAWLICLIWFTRFTLSVSWFTWIILKMIPFVHQKHGWITLNDKSRFALNQNVNQLIPKLWFGWFIDTGHSFNPTLIWFIQHDLWDSHWFISNPIHPRYSFTHQKHNSCNTIHPIHQVTIHPNCNVNQLIDSWGINVPHLIHGIWDSHYLTESLIHLIHQSLDSFESYPKAESQESEWFQ